MELLKLQIELLGLQNEATRLRLQDKSLLYAALSKAQAEYLPLKADSTAQWGNYCSLQAILNKNVVETNEKYGLSVIIKPFSENGIKKISAKLCHESNQVEESICDMVYGSNEASERDAFGGANTYMGRYMVRGLLGLGDNADPIEGQEKKSINYKEAPKKDYAQAKIGSMITPDQISLVQRKLGEKTCMTFLSAILEQYEITELSQLTGGQARELIDKLLGK